MLKSGSRLSGRARGPADGVIACYSSGIPMSAAHIPQADSLPRVRAFVAFDLGDPEPAAAPG